MKGLSAVVILAAMLLPAVQCGAADRVDPEGDWRQLSALLAKSDIDPAWRDYRGRTLVYFYLRYGSEDLALSVLEASSRSTARMEGDQRLLDLAIREGSQRLVRRMLELGEMPNAITALDQSPLIIAASLGRLEILRLLIKAGANVEYRLRGFSAAKAALGAGQERAFRYLAEAGFDLKAERAVMDGENLIFYAIAGNSVGAVLALDEAGFDVNRPRRNGLSPLLYSLQQRKADALIEVLLDIGANACEKDAKGRNALQLARGARADRVQLLDPRYEELLERLRCR